MYRTYMPVTGTFWFAEETDSLHGVEDTEMNGTFPEQVCSICVIDDRISVHLLERVTGEDKREREF